MLQMLKQFLGEAATLGYAISISPELEETTEESERAARVSLHGYRICVREIGPDSLRDWIPMDIDTDILPTLRAMHQAREEKRKADQLRHEAWVAKRKESEARQREILEAERGKSEMEAIREREGQSE